MEIGQRRQFIATKAGWTYGRAMVAGLIRLLALIAFVSMPVGMSAASAAPHEPAAAAPTHCSGHDQPEPAAPADKDVKCTGCTAIPAAAQAVVSAELSPTAPRALELAASFAGIEPGISTPPPRRS